MMAWSMILGVLLLSASVLSEPVDCGNSNWCRQFCPFLHDIFLGYTAGLGDIEHFGIEFGCHNDSVSDEVGWAARENKNVCDDWCKLIHGYYDGAKDSQFLKCLDKGPKVVPKCKDDPDCVTWCNNIHELKRFLIPFEYQCIHKPKPPKNCDDYYTYSMGCPLRHGVFPLDELVNNCFYDGMINVPQFYWGEFY